MTVRRRVKIGRRNLVETSSVAVHRRSRVNKIKAADFASDSAVYLVNSVDVIVDQIADVVRIRSEVDGIRVIVFERIVERLKIYFALAVVRIDESSHYLGQVGFEC